MHMHWFITVWFCNCHLFYLGPFFTVWLSRVQYRVCFYYHTILLQDQYACFCLDRTLFLSTVTIFTLNMSVWTNFLVACMERSIKTIYFIFLPDRSYFVIHHAFISLYFQYDFNLFTSERMCIVWLLFLARRVCLYRVYVVQGSERILVAIRVVYRSPYTHCTHTHTT